jgi:caffeoyl-CoA O-methyltransferase
VNPTPEQYVESLYSVDHLLERVKEGIRSEGMPEVSVAPAYGRLLTMLVQISGARRVLEIGALGGYSGICLARGLREDGQLISLEFNPDFVQVAEKHLSLAGLRERVEYRVGDASVSLQQLQDEEAKFDLVFIDADKGGYPHYLDMSIQLANPGALIIGDNILMHGKSMDPSKESPSVKAMRAFNLAMAAHPRLDSTILPAYDGLAIARVKL